MMLNFNIFFKMLKCIEWVINQQNYKLEIITLIY